MVSTRRSKLLEQEDAFLSDERKVERKRRREDADFYRGKEEQLSKRLKRTQATSPGNVAPIATASIGPIAASAVSQTAAPAAVSLSRSEPVTVATFEPSATPEQQTAEVPVCEAALKQGEVCPRCGAKFTGAQAPKSGNNTNAGQSKAGNEKDTSAWRKQSHNDSVLGRIVDPQDATAGRISRRFPNSITATTPKGLANLGNSCYRNSMLQCLLHTPAFYHFLGNVHADCAAEEHKCPTCALQRLVQAYWHPDVKARQQLRPRLVSHFNALKHKIPADLDEGPGSAVAEDLHANKESDPFDFAIRGLIELLQDHATGDPIFAALLSNTFDVYIKKVWICGKCKHVNDDYAGKTEEQWVKQAGLDVQIDSPERGLPLAHYLRDAQFIEPGTFECDECKKRMKAVKSHRIVKAPEVLILRLKRLGVSMDEEGKMKMRPIVDIYGQPTYDKKGNLLQEAVEEFRDDDVAFDQLLDLGQYTDDDSDLVYKLDGVVSHLNNGVGGGHYIAGVRNIDDKSVSVCDDGAIVRQSFTMDMFTAERDYGGSDYYPYVLVYHRIM